MQQYKTIIIVNLDGAGVTYYVREDIDTVNSMFENLEHGTGQGFKWLTFYKVMKHGILIEMLTINPENCASIEIYESCFAGNGK